MLLNIRTFAGRGKHGFLGKVRETDTVSVSVPKEPKQTEKATDSFSDRLKSVGSLSICSPQVKDRQVELKTKC